MQDFNEATVLALMVSARKEGRFAHPAIVQKGTNVMIDGFHRTEAVKRLAVDGVEIHLSVEEYETNDPIGLAIEINKTRRSWTTEEERRTQVQFLATQTDAEGNSFTNQQIAEAVGTSEKTVRRDKSKAAGSASAEPAAKPATPAKGKDGKRQSVTKVTGEEIARAWAMKDSGMSTAAIAQDLGRGETTVRAWFRKERPEAVVAAQPVAPAPPAPSTEPDPVSGMLPRQPGAPLPQLSKDIITRERKAAAKRTSRLATLVELDAEMTLLWKFAQKRFEADGRSVLRNHMGLADEAMVADGVISSACVALGLPPEAGYEEMLRGVDVLAKRLSRSARQAIYLFGYTDGMPG